MNTIEISRMTAPGTDKPTIPAIARNMDPTTPKISMSIFRAAPDDLDALTSLSAQWGRTSGNLMFWIQKIKSLFKRIW